MLLQRPWWSYEKWIILTLKDLLIIGTEQLLRWLHEQHASKSRAEKWWWCLMAGKLFWPQFEVAHMICFIAGNFQRPFTNSLCCSAFVAFLFVIIIIVVLNCFSELVYCFVPVIIKFRKVSKWKSAPSHFLDHGNFLDFKQNFSEINEFISDPIAKENYSLVSLNFQSKSSETSGRGRKFTRFSQSQNKSLGCFGTVKWEA